MRLELEWRERRVADLTRRYLKFVVDGESLSGERYRAWAVSVLGWGTSEAEERAARRLLLEEPPDVGERVSLYVCALCGDIGCGATTVFVEPQDDEIVWREAAWSTPALETESVDRNSDRLAYRQWPDELRFDATEYRRLIEGRPRAAAQS